MLEQILQFGQNHWLLVAALVVILILLVVEEIRNKMTGIPKISAQNTVLLLNRENSVIVDLRSQKAFGDGHILGSINIARADVDQNIKKIEPHKDKNLILVDDYDHGATPIGAKLKAQNFTKIYILAGGIPAWKDAGLPLNKN